MNYSECIEYLNNINILGVKINLDRITSLLNRLDNPQDKLRCIHIAGTNGKGSISSMTSSILTKSGLKVGLYTSPHLISYNERIKINGVDISEEDFSYVANIIIKEAKIVEKEDGEHPTFFECLTAIAFYHFYIKNIDILVLEVGLGGRLDATNVIKQPLISAITSISIDHINILGDNISVITKEKSGIIKKNKPTVLYFTSEEVYNIINSVCEEKNSTLYCEKNVEMSITKSDINGSIFSIKSEKLDYKDIFLPLLGEHQIKNVVVVFQIIKLLNTYGYNIKEDSVREGLESVKWPCRMELVKTSPYILIDGAHNISGMKALAKGIESYFDGYKKVLVIGVLGDKEYENMLDIISPFFDKIIITKPISHRALDSDIIYEYLKNKGIECIKEEDISSAIYKAIGISKKDELICIAGSLYLAGEAKKILGRE